MKERKGNAARRRRNGARQYWSSELVDNESVLTLRMTWLTLKDMHPMKSLRLQETAKKTRKQKISIYMINEINFGLIESTFNVVLVKSISW